MSEPKISADELRSFSQRIFESAGVNSDDAKYATDVLIWASLRGVDTHGIRNLKRYYIDTAGGVGRRDGVICFDAELTTEFESPTAAALNANFGLGLSVSVRAMNLAIEKAQNTGVGIVTVRNSTHFGPAGYFAHMAVPHDMLGFASTGYLFANGQPKSVVPFGGLLPMLSTNPLAMACPGATGPDFVLDMATSVVPVNRVEMLEELGKAIPAGWSLDENHQTTDDPDDVQKMEPLGGATTYGGHKGFGLAVAGWILTGLLAGAWRKDADANRVLGDNSATKHGFAQEGIAHSFAAVRLDQFGDPTLIKQGLDAMTQTFNDSPAAPGFDRVIIPGQLEAETEVDRRQNGIPLSPSTAVDLRSLSEEFGIPLSIG
ncbi:MAG: L-2-hydroxycarboxylate dehydrogenase (NAD+) [Porticoccaceae bacterium]|jgi:L-2-hydroxycarboxylate dehydrogenase (NAD+)